MGSTRSGEHPRRAVGWLGGLLLASVALTARGETEPIRIEYQAHEGCPDRASFVAQIAARTPLMRAAVGEEPSRLFRIRIRRVGAGTSGRLEAQDVTGAVTVREVGGDRCDDVASALALTVALAIDPQALSRPPAASSAPAPSAAPSSTSTAFKVAGPEPIPTGKSHPGGHARFGAGLQMVVSTGVTPNLVVGGAIAAEVIAYEPSAPSLWEPSLRLLLTYGRSDILVHAEQATFAWMFGGAEACPLVVRVASFVALRPCLTVHGGVLRGEGRSVANARSVAAGWFDVGVAARVAFPLSARVTWELQGELIRPISRPLFTFETPKTVIHETPPWLFLARMGLMVHFS